MIYIVKINSRSSNYGIGSYIEQLKTCLDILDKKYCEINLSEDISYFEMKKLNSKSCIYNFPKVKGISYETYFRNVFFVLKKYFNGNEKEMIFHVNCTGPFSLFESIKRIFPSSQIIMTLHYTNWSFEINGNYESLKKILEKKNSKKHCEIRSFIEGDRTSFSLCDKIITIAKHSYDYVTETCKIKKEKVFIIPNALKDNFLQKNETIVYTLRNKYKVPQKSKIIFFAGRIDYQKNVLSLIKVFKKIIDQVPDSFLYIAGDGAILKECIEKAFPFNSKIIFLGYLSKEIVSEFYILSDIGVVCSLYEEFGLVAIEMMMHELPVVLSNTGGLADIGTDGKDCLKFPIVNEDNKIFSDEEQLENQIKMLLSNSELRESIAQEGRKIFLENYELSHWLKQMELIYNS